MRLFFNDNNGGRDSCKLVLEMEFWVGGEEVQLGKLWVVDFRNVHHAWFQLALTTRAYIRCQVDESNKFKDGLNHSYCHKFLARERCNVNALYEILVGIICLLFIFNRRTMKVVEIWIIQWALRETMNNTKNLNLANQLVSKRMVEANKGEMFIIRRKPL